MITERVRELTGAEPAAARPVGGGDICDAYRLDSGDGGDSGDSGDGGRPLFAKTLADPPPGFFRAEADGLALLAGTGAVAVPEVVAVDEDLLVLEWVEPGPPSHRAAERLGRDLAALHDSPAPAWGTPGRPAYLGPLPLPSPGPPSPEHAAPGTSSLTEPEDWPAFHAEYRLLPFLRQAADHGAMTDADVRAVERLCAHLDQVAGPPQQPAVIHGDLWSGNVHWAADGRARLIDPAAQGGHPETDLAMLDLFGCPHLDRVLAAYEEVRPVPGRAERVPLHQVQHLLVHAVLFGGGYGARCGAAARAALG